MLIRERLLETYGDLKCCLSKKLCILIFSDNFLLIVYCYICPSYHSYFFYAQPLNFSYFSNRLFTYCYRKNNILLIRGSKDMLTSMSILQYCQQVNGYWNRKNGNMLSELLSLRHSHSLNKSLWNPKPENSIPAYIDDYLAELICAHIRCIYAVSESDAAEAYNEQNNVVQVFIKIFQYFKEENWLLPVMNTICLELRLIAGKVEALPVKGSHSSAIKPREALEKAAETLMTCFRICSSDNRSSEQDTKKWGMLSLVNQLFKLYFRINKLHLMKPLIRAIDSSPLKDKFPLSQQVTYRYYVGRKAMFDSDYNLANENLTFAFQSCHKMSKKNKHLILIYLVPLKILLGYLPTRSLLEKYDLLQLWEVGEAVRCGNSRKLTEAIEKHQEFFIKTGIYLILERLRLVTYRNLFKKVFLITKTSVVQLEDLLTALRFSESPDLELDEANCILANLIHQGKVKGYISHSHQKVVFSKTDAFPKLSSLT